MANSFPSDILDKYMLVVIVLMLPIIISEIWNARIKPHKLKNGLISLGLYSLGMIAFCVVGSSIEQGRWDHKFILKHLLLEKTGNWLFRDLLPIAYLVLIVVAVGALKYHSTKRKTPNQAL